MTRFSQTFTGKLGVFKNNDNIQLPSLSAPVVPTVISRGTGVGNTTLEYPAPGGGTWVYHTFTSSGTLVVGLGTTAGISDADVLVVGGGGGGGALVWPGSSFSVQSGGGGGGGVVYATAVELPADTYTIVVGAGGSDTGEFMETTGGDSYILSGFGTDVIRAYGGGRGAGKGGPAGITTAPAANGGSGGGGGGSTPEGLLSGGVGLQSSYSSPWPTGIVTAGGYPGANHPGSHGGAGGGGAFQAGFPGLSGGSWNTLGGPGGIGTNPTPQGLTEFEGSTIGIPALSPESGHFGGGGGGCGGRHPQLGRSISPTVPGIGGLGGGGNGAVTYQTGLSIDGQSGLQNSGGGGGAGRIHPSTFAREGVGTGGSGVVVIRYRAPIV